MVPPKGAHVGDVLAKFRSQQAKAAKIQSDAAKEREEKLKKIQGGGAPGITTQCHQWEQRSNVLNTASMVRRCQEDYLGQTLQEQSEVNNFIRSSSI